MAINMLFLSWRDINHPKRGGAEIYTHEMLKEVDKKQYKFVHISPLSKGKDGQNNKKSETIDGVVYLRYGNNFTVILHAMAYYIKNRKRIDYVVDQCNSHRFFTPFWVSKKKRVLFIHQLTREIWEMNLRFPFGWMASKLENVMLWIYRKNKVITVSDSTKKDLVSVGIPEKNITILPEGIDFTPWPLEEKKEAAIIEFSYVGRYSAYKGIDDAVEAFCQLYAENKDIHLNIVGKKNDAYIEEKLIPIIKKYRVPEKCITYWGFVSEEKKLEIMHDSYCMLFPSKREGWGLTVTEAAAVGTPSIVYNSPGLVDAVDKGRCGYMTPSNTPVAIKNMMVEAISDTKKYETIRDQAHELALTLNWKNTAYEFEETFGRGEKE